MPWRDFAPERPPRSLARRSGDGVRFCANACRLLTARSRVTGGGASLEVMNPRGVLRPRGPVRRAEFRGFLPQPRLAA